MKPQLSSKLYKLIIIFFSLTFLIGNYGVSALTSAEIAAQIAAKQKELDQINKDLSGAQKELSTSTDKKNSSKSQIDKIKAELAEVHDTLNVNKIQADQLQQSIDLKNLQKQGKEKLQDEQIVDSYINWKADDLSSNIFIGGGDTVKKVVYYESIAADSQKDILGLASEIDQLDSQNKQYQQQVLDLEKQVADLTSQQEYLQKQIDLYNQAIARANSNADGLRSRSRGVTQAISQLTAEQQAIQNADNSQTGGGGSGGTETLPSGSVYFSGRGRDLYQGHGVGLSQYGAYGAARNGWSAEHILTFYYQNTSIGSVGGRTITVNGYGTMSADDYVAGLGEVPSYACGTLDQINAWKTYADGQGWASNDPRRNKYVIDNTSTTWDCWPEEAIKAQVIAARSYGATYVGSICTTASCQVYTGSKAKAWAAFQTSNQYVMYNGGIIHAYYSSDNSQGYGTANNDTVWSNFGGDGTPVAYLRHVDDTAVAANGGYRDWTWRTNGYTMAQINSLFQYGADHYTTGGTSSFMKSMKSTVGTVTSLTLEKDNSNRVKKVRVIGTNGQKVMAGWLFKALWNDWIANVRPSGQTDYIYSTTFSFATQ